MVDEVVILVMTVAIMKTRMMVSISTSISVMTTKVTSILKGWKMPLWTGNMFRKIGNDAHQKMD